MKYSKIVPNGLYARETHAGTQYGTMRTAVLRHNGKATGELNVPGQSVAYVTDGSPEDDWLNWRYVGGGQPFPGYVAPDVNLTGPQQSVPPEGVDYEAMDYNDIVAIAKQRGVPYWRRAKADIVNDLRA